MGTENRNEAVQLEAPPTDWTLAMRVVFLFCLVYFALFTLTTKISGGLALLPDRSITSLGILWPLRGVTFWIGTHIFGITEPLDYTGNSWDTNFYWVQAAWVLFVAVLVAGAWCALDTRRRNYVTLHKWMRVFVRLAIASQMFEYGITKVIPAQFPAPSLITLVTPVGGISLQGLLWTFVGSSLLYQVLTGIIELAGGLLLLHQRTTLVGSFIVLASMMQILAFNMLYDVGVKMVTFHLILMTLFLMAPEWSRLRDFFFRNRSALPPAERRLFRAHRANRIAVAAQILFGLYAVGVYTNITWRFWNEGGGGSPRSVLYGIWDVEQLAINGEVGPAVINDYDRQWRRVIFDEPDEMVFQRTDDSFSRYGVSIDDDRNILVLTKGESRNWRSGFIFQRPVEDQLILEGDMDDYSIRMELRLIQPDTFQLLNSHFRWVRPPDPGTGSPR